MDSTNLRDAYEFDPQTYGTGGTGGLLGRLLALQAEQSRYQASSGDDGQAPIVQGNAGNSAPAPTSTTVSSFDAYPSYDPSSYDGQNGLLGRLIALQREQGNYQPNTGINAVAPPSPTPSSRTQVQRNEAIQVATPFDFFNNLARAFANGVPIVGGLNNKIEAGLEATLAPALNPVFDSKNQLNEPTWQGRYGDALRKQNDIDARFAKEDPITATAAGLAGNLSTLWPLGSTELGARMLGLAKGPLSEAMLQSATTRAAIGGADASIRGEPPGKNISGNAAIGAGWAAVIQALIRAFE